MHTSVTEIMAAFIYSPRGLKQSQHTCINVNIYCRTVQRQLNIQAFLCMTLLGNVIVVQGFIYQLALKRI